MTCFLWVCYYSKMWIKNRISQWSQTFDRYVICFYAFGKCFYPKRLTTHLSTSLLSFQILGFPHSLFSGNRKTLKLLNDETLCYLWLIIMIYEKNKNHEMWRCICAPNAMLYQNVHIFIKQNTKNCLSCVMHFKWLHPGNDQYIKVIFCHNSYSD